MSSELLGHNSPHEGELAPVIPIQRKKGKTVEAHDFTDDNAETVINFFFEELRQPSSQRLNGEDLAAYIESQLSNRGDIDTSTPQGRLSQIVSDADMFADDELYDHKFEYDPVFKKLLEKRESSSTEIRHAALRLAELRSTIRRDETDLDEKGWLPVIDRLFT